MAIDWLKGALGPEKTSQKLAPEHRKLLVARLYSAKPTGALALITSGELHNLAVACSWSPLEMPFSRSVTDCTSSANEA